MVLMKEELVNDSLVVDRFIEELRTFADVQSQLGDHRRALITSKAAQVIQLLTRHCTDMNIGIPARQILSITSEKQ